MLLVGEVRFMPPKAYVPACGIRSCKYFKTVKYLQRCGLGRSNKNGKNYYGICPLYEPKERAKRLPHWYKKPERTN